MTNTHALPLLASLIFLSFLGSWHCALMCSPIALSMSRKGGLWRYHAGRAISYVVAGAISGWMGQSLFRIESLSGKIVAAVILSGFFILQLLPQKQRFAWGHRLFDQWIQPGSGAFVWGLGSVFLPCGWLWTFLAAAAAAGNPTVGVLITGILWLSTLPALSVLPSVFQKALAGHEAQKVKIANQILCLAGIYSVWSHFFL